MIGQPHRSGSRPIEGGLHPASGADRASCGHWYRRASTLATVVAHPGAHGCGNGAAVEITKRFPPRLGNLAQHARFPQIR